MPFLACLYVESSHGTGSNSQCLGIFPGLGPQISPTGWSFFHTFNPLQHSALPPVIEQGHKEIISSVVYCNSLGMVRDPFWKFDAGI